MKQLSDVVSYSIISMLTFRVNKPQKKDHFEKWPSFCADAGSTPYFFSQTSAPLQLCHYGTTEP